jgi:hypothetical protein
VREIALAQKMARTAARWLGDSGVRARMVASDNSPKTYFFASIDIRQSSRTGEFYDEFSPAIFVEIKNLRRRLRSPPLDWRTALSTETMPASLPPAIDPALCHIIARQSVQRAPKAG